MTFEAEHPLNSNTAIATVAGAKGFIVGHSESE
jgi:hypothetical protein